MPRKTSLAKSLTKLLDAADTPVYLLDAERRLVYGNSAFAKWVGRAADELAGLKCPYTSSGELSGAAEIASALAPPPEAFLGQLDKGLVSAPDSDGKLVSRPARFVSIAADGEQPLALVVFVGSNPVGAASPASVFADDLHARLQMQRSEMGRRFHIGQLVGQSPAIRRVREQIRLAAASQARVLIVGPQGSGREQVARTIHYGPQRSGTTVGPLVPLDGGLLDAELMQSSVMAFLKRQREWKGNRPPSLLLKDADRLRPDAQQEMAELLRLPHMELPILSIARVPLQRLAGRGKYREDLAYALSPLTIVLPPLKKRLADLPLLAQFFLEEFNSTGGRQLAGFAPDAIDILAAHEWPGNVEELKELVHMACQKADGPQVQAVELPDRLHHAARIDSRPESEPRIVLDDCLAKIETELLQRAMQKARGNKTRAAELLGIHRARLIRRLVQLGLAPPAAAEEPVVFEPVEEEPSS